MVDQLQLTKRSNNSDHSQPLMAYGSYGHHSSTFRHLQCFLCGKGDHTQTRGDAVNQLDNKRAVQVAGPILTNGVGDVTSQSNNGIYTVYLHLALSLIHI